MKSQNNFVYLSLDIYKITMTTCRVFNCTNEKGKCEKIFFCIYGSYPWQHIDNKKHGKVDNIGDKHVSYKMS
jgi:hypothetical protein